MSDEMVLADTSVWIEYFNRPKSRTAEKMTDLLKQDRIVLAGPIIAEIVRGVRTVKEKNLILSTLDILPYYGLDMLDWVAAGLMLLTFRKEGKTHSIIDAILAQTCIRYGLVIYTLDKHFDDFKKFNLKIHKPGNTKR